MSKCVQKSDQKKHYIYKQLFKQTFLLVSLFHQSLLYVLERGPYQRNDFTCIMLYVRKGFSHKNDLLLHVSSSDNPKEEAGRYQHPRV